MDQDVRKEGPAREAAAEARGAAEAKQSTRHASTRR